MNNVSQEAETGGFVLPTSTRTAFKSYSTAKHRVGEAFKKAGMDSPDAHLDKIGLEGTNPSNRAEAKRAVERGMDQAVVHHSDPERLAEIGDHLRYLLPFYGVNAGKLDPLTQRDRENRFKNSFSSKEDRAVYTQMLVDIYNGSVSRLKKGAEKSGATDLLKLGEGEKDITTIPRIKKLEDEYHAATSRDPKSIYTLEQGKDGRYRAVKKAAPTLSDWGKEVMGGMQGSGSHEEAMGYFVGKSIKSLLKLVTPGAMELHKDTDVRASTAKVLNQLESLGKQNPVVKAGQSKENKTDIKQDIKLERPAAANPFPGRASTYAM